MNRKPPNLYVREYRTRAATNESSTMSGLRIGKAYGYFVRKVHKLTRSFALSVRKNAHISFIDAPEAIKKIL